MAATAGDETWAEWTWGLTPPGWFGVEYPYAETEQQTYETAAGARSAISETARDVKDIAGYGPDAARESFEDWKRRQTQGLVLGIGATVLIVGGVGWLAYKYLGEK